MLQFTASAEPELLPHSSLPFQTCPPSIPRKLTNIRRTQVVKDVEELRFYADFTPGTSWARYGTQVHTIPGRSPTRSRKRHRRIFNFVHGILGGPRSNRIGHPLDPIHVTHVNFDSFTREFIVGGSRSVWERLLRDAGLSEAKLAMEIAKKAHPGDIRWGNEMCAVPAPLDDQTDDLLQNLQVDSEVPSGRRVPWWIVTPSLLADGRSYYAQTSSRKKVEADTPQSLETIRPMLDDAPGWTPEPTTTTTTHQQNSQSVRKGTRRYVRVRGGWPLPEHPSEFVDPKCIRKASEADEPPQDWDTEAPGAGCSGEVEGLMREVPDARIPQTSPELTALVCGYLNKRGLPPHQLSSLIEAIISSKDERDAIDGLLPADAQNFIDVVNEALDRLDLAPRTRKQCLKSLYRACGRHALLPTTLKIVVSYDQTRDALYRGGFADVWKGKHDGQDVAVKVLRTYSNSDFQRIIGRFCKEVVMWKSLRHPNVLPLVGITISETRFAMISNWMANGNINDFVRTNPNVDRLGLLAGVARGLIYIHSQGMIHGDLKGANILVDDTGSVRLADFGLLTIVSDSTNILTSSSSALGGTARWMGPELIDPQRFGLENNRPTQASDCYALGMVIYETMSGKPPFHQHGDLTVFTKVLAGERPTRGEGFVDSLWRMLKLCWRARPDNRPRIEGVLRCLERA